MPWYRLYVRDREGHFSAVREFEACDEAQAISRVDRTCHGLACELWLDQTMVGRWDEEQTDNLFEGRPRWSQTS